MSFKNKLFSSISLAVLVMLISLVSLLLKLVYPSTIWHLPLASAFQLAVGLGLLLFVINSCFKSGVLNFRIIKIDRIVIFRD